MLENADIDGNDQISIPNTNGEIQNDGHDVQDTVAKVTQNHLHIEEKVDNENHSILNTDAEIEDNEKEDQNTGAEETHVNDKLENNEDLSVLNTQSSENKEDTSDDESVLDKDLTLTTKQNLKHEE